MFAKLHRIFLVEETLLKELEDVACGMFECNTN